MSRLFEALSGLKSEQGTAEVAVTPAVSPPDGEAPKSKAAKAEHHSLKVISPAIPLSLAPEPLYKSAVSNEVQPRPDEAADAPVVHVNASPDCRLVALTDPNGLGAEKFRALVTRLDHLRNQRELKSFQVTSSVINEGKTLVAGNAAVTLAKYSRAKTLLIEGDLHRPTLAKLFGLTELTGLNQWWHGPNLELGKSVHRLNDMPLWFLPAGKPLDQPSDLLRSARFAKAFAQLASEFEWVVVDSTPMLPIVDVNLWSRLVDGTLLVVREGVTPTKALKRGLQALDHPKLIGVVFNEATEFDRAAYEGNYYGGTNHLEKSNEQR